MSARTSVQPPFIGIAGLEIPPAIDTEVGDTIVVVIGGCRDIETAAELMDERLAGRGIDEKPVRGLRRDVRGTRALAIQSNIGSAVTVEVELEAVIDSKCRDRIK